MRIEITRKKNQIVRRRPIDESPRKACGGSVRLTSGQLGQLPFD